MLVSVRPGVEPARVRDALVARGLWVEALIDATGRTHFLAIAALSMRQVLVDRARRRAAAKRGGAAQRLTLDDAMLAVGQPGDAVDLIALDDALTRLEALDALQARIVELRYFGGLTVEETAEAVDLSPATVKRHWTLARAFLKKALDGPA